MLQTVISQAKNTYSSQSGKHVETFTFKKPRSQKKATDQETTKEEKEEDKAENAIGGVNDTKVVVLGSGRS